MLSTEEMQLIEQIKSTDGFEDWIATVETEVDSEDQVPLTAMLLRLFSENKAIELLDGMESDSDVLLRTLAVLRGQEPAEQQRKLGHLDWLLPAIRGSDQLYDYLEGISDNLPNYHEQPIVAFYLLRLLCTDEHMVSVKESFGTMDEVYLRQSCLAMLDGRDTEEDREAVRNQEHPKDNEVQEDEEDEDEVEEDDTAKVSALSSSDLNALVSLRNKLRGKNRRTSDEDVTMNALTACMIAHGRS